MFFHTMPIVRTNLESFIKDVKDTIEFGSAETVSFDMSSIMILNENACKKDESGNFEIF